MTRWQPTTEDRTVTVRHRGRRYTVTYRWTAGWRGDRNPLERPEFEVLAIEPPPPPPPADERAIVELALDLAERDGW